VGGADQYDRSEQINGFNQQASGLFLWCQFKGMLNSISSESDSTFKFLDPATSVVAWLETMRVPGCSGTMLGFAAHPVNNERKQII